MANKDYFDRIADALQIISGDDSHIDDIDKNMDYYKRIAQALENIAESDGGSGLPAVTSDDNGDVLSVVNGTWAKAVPLPMAYVIPGDYTDGDVISHDYDNIFLKAWDEGYIVLFVVSFIASGSLTVLDVIAEIGTSGSVSLTGKTTVTLTEGEDGYTVSVTPVGE